MRITSCGITDVGLKRGHNEDNFLINEELNLFVVADGMGGHVAGNIASELAVAAVTERPPDDDIEVDDRVLAANAAILERVHEDQNLAGMGTTMTLGRFNDDETVDIAHVGDSRCYLFRDGELTQITADHTVVAEQVMSGVIDVEQARTHPLRNVVTRALGGKEELVVDMRVLDLQDMDLLLLCTDGLTAMLNDQEILGIILANGHDKQRALRGLIDAANDRGGEDNTTAVLLSLHDD